MSDEQDPQQTADDITRRDFVAMSIAAGIAIGAGATTVDAQASVVETSVDVKTPDGTSDAVFVHPATGTYPGVLIWPDAFGRRPSMLAIAKRIAAEGYSVLLPNPFYRTAKAPVFEDPSKFDFANTADRAKLGPLMGPLNAEGAAERDAIAYIAFLDTQKQVDRSRKVGTQGYCMGGPLIMKTAAAVPNRVGAAASFHGGGLVTPQPTSPHLLIPKMKARLYIGIAVNDDMQQPTAKDTLKQAFADAKVPAEIEVYPTAQHGWCVPDMPLQANGMPIYNKEAAERAWGKLVALYKAGLA
jgi:carboxymethylenebutenolidase